MALISSRAWRRLLASGVLAALAATAALSTGGVARAGSGACGDGYCVVLIEVNGLTPQDVTPQNTPFMWALAHPEEPGQNAGIANALLKPPGGVDRAGWIWQAPRGVMSASNAAATASVLTGAYPEHSGVPADEYRDGPTWKAIGSHGGDGGTPENPSLAELAGDSILKLVQQDAPSNQAFAKAYVGDPALFDLATDSADQCQGDPNTPAEVPGWRPGAPQDTTNCKGVTVDPQASDPALCTPPANPSTAADQACPADDAVTMNAATNDLQSNPSLRLSYIYLAELGIAKQRSGNVQGALSDTDQAIAQYVETYVQGSAALGQKWNNTVLMVVGNHGYESTPQVLRVPNPQDTTQTTSLKAYIQSIDGNGNVTVVPQGSMALVYYTGDPSNTTARDTVLRNVRSQVVGLNSNPNLPQCNSPDASSAAVGKCIDDVLYTAPNAQDGGSANTVAAKHPTWHIGGGPAAVVLMGRGWAAAQATPAVSTNNTPDTSDTNPYPASDGGPRNRSVAALLDGPNTRIVQINPPSPDGSWDGRDPVSQGPATGDPNNQTPAYQSAPADTQQAEPAVVQANASPEDDTGKEGHEQQPVTVDFMPTIAALMKVSTGANQLDGNIIQVPFRGGLAAFNDSEDIGQALPDALPPELPPPVIVPPPPPPPGYDFHGLIRNLHAGVGTVIRGRFITARQARRGTRLHYIDLNADFGKPLTAVTLTLYKRKPKSAHAARRSQLVTIARFMPFTVHRGPGVDLRFKVPAQFKPTTIGVSVQEAVPSSPKPTKPGGKPQPNFRGVGPTGGGVVPLRDAALLHKRAPGPRRR